MTEVYRRKPAPPDWPRPAGLISREIDRTTGLLQNSFCPRSVVYTEWYVSGTEPVQECDVHSATDTAVGDTLNMQRTPTAEGVAPPAASPGVPRPTLPAGATAAAPSAGAAAATPVAGPPASAKPATTRAAAPPVATAVRVPPPRRVRRQPLRDNLHLRTPRRPVGRDAPVDAGMAAA